MAAKKAQSKAPAASASMDSKAMWGWLHVISGLTAAVAGAFSFENTYLAWALILVGVLVGLFFTDTEDLTNFGVRYLLTGAVINVFSAVPVVGMYISGFVGGFFTYLGPVALVTLCMWFWKKYFANMM